MQGAVISLGVICFGQMLIEMQAVLFFWVFFWGGVQIVQRKASYFCGNQVGDGPKTNVISSEPTFMILLHPHSVFQESACVRACVKVTVEGDDVTHLVFFIVRLQQPMRCRYGKMEIR